MAIAAAAMSMCCRMTSPRSPSSIVVSPVGRPSSRGDHHLRIAAEDELAEADQEIGEPDRRHQKDDVRLVDEMAHDEPLHAERQHAHDGDGEDEREPRRNAGFVEADERQGGEHHHDPLREVENAGRLEDQHEAERDQRIEDTADKALPQDLQQKVRRPRHLQEGVDEDRMEELHRGPQCGTPR